MVEWVEKVSFSRINKLFKIGKEKHNHNVLLTENNLKFVIANPKLFVIPVFPWLAPPTLVSSEHFVLKDFPF